MTERTVQFAEQGRLRGVLTAPDVEQANGTAIVLVSAGLMPLCGPYRLYTELARRLEASGFATLRFDLGGVGNSDVLDTSTPLPDRTHADIRAAVDFVIEQQSPRTIVVGGLCSGAEDSFRFAARDERIGGVVLIDPHAYKTWTWYIRSLFSRMFLSRIIYKVLRLTQIVDVVIKRTVEGLEGDLVDYDYMDHVEATEILEILNARGVPYHYLYTGGRNDYFNHRTQFYRMFPAVRFAGIETVSHLPHIEHVQVFEEDRAELIEMLARWMERSFDD